MSETSEHGWAVTLNAVEKGFGRRPREHAVLVVSRRTDRREAVAEAEWRYRNDVSPWVDLDAVEVVDVARVVPGPRAPQD